MKSEEKIKEIINSIKCKKYDYFCEFEGYVTSWIAEESEDGLFYTVSLHGETKESNAYANHKITIGNDTINCHEFMASPKQWFFNEEEFDFSTYEELYALLNNIIEPFDFEEYAIDNFDWDVQAESIPYGYPYCLIADGCTFMIAKGGETFTEQDVRELLKNYHWSDERIDKVIREGYELTDDVCKCLDRIPIIFCPDED